MVSKSKYNLSATEMEIMEFLWDTNKKLSASEILKYFNDNKSKNWKKQTLNTFLVKLIEKGALQYDMVKNKKYIITISIKGVVKKYCTTGIPSIFCLKKSEIVFLCFHIITILAKAQKYKNISSNFHIILYSSPNIPVISTERLFNT